MRVYERVLVGSLAGDIIGSVYEYCNIKTKDFLLFNKECSFTDDTVLTIAVADAILNNLNFAQTFHRYGNVYKDRGYGLSFMRWLKSDNPKPYGSYGNGSAMRVSPAGLVCESVYDTMALAKKTAEVTHNHPEGIKGAQAVASAVYLARHNYDKNEIKKFIEKEFEYDLSFTLDQIRDIYCFDETCQGTVPFALVAFLESKNFEDAIRLAISIGGDSDTIACITGSIAGGFYHEIPREIVDFVYLLIPNEFKVMIREFDECYYTKHNEDRTLSISEFKNILEEENELNH
jgi:ADP-ribosylglycohydrolase